MKFITPKVKQLNSNVILIREKLSLVDTTIFLGITLDIKLQWSPHISKLASRLSSAAYAVKSLEVLPVLKQLNYFTLAISIA